GGDIALCHNGHVINVDDLRAELAPRHDRVDEMSDTAVITCRFGERFAGDVESSVRLTFEAVKGAYSVLILTPNGVAALRDPFGIRPLSLGRKGTATIISSETCAIDAVGGNLVRDVEPGELLLLNEGTVRSTTFQRAHAWPAQCIFELVYFARPDSVVFGHAVASVRMALGRQLAREAPAMADIVVPIPESAVYAALGYAQESGIDYSMALFRNGFVGRSFIEPDPPVRNLAVRTKLNPVKGLVQGRRVVLVDDSIVRGNTCGQVVAKLRQAGAREVHVRVASPPTVASCYFGVDTPDVRELFAVGRGIAEMRQALDADSLQFLSLEGLMHAVGLDARRFCSACFSGVYPLDVSRMPRRWHAPLRCA
ncbi:MAG: amidophosphoribosyltransferase, partial [Acidobacteria bacterium]|nr:amidophosphoribosyltransferase [Acidobacteriota bacterium]